MHNAIYWKLFNNTLNNLNYVKFPQAIAVLLASHVDKHLSIVCL